MGLLRFPISANLYHNTAPMGLRISIKNHTKKKAQKADILVIKIPLTELKPQRGGIIIVTTG
jgi:hypothetical protein